MRIMNKSWDYILKLLFAAKCLFNYLIVVYLTTVCQWLRLYTAELSGDMWMANWKGRGKSGRGLL
jgi:hypothetical protein